MCAVIREEEMPFFIVGGGANLLVRDGGIRGAVICTGRLQQIRQEGRYIVADAGVSTARTARFAMERGLSGMEFAGASRDDRQGGLYECRRLRRRNEPHRGLGSDLRRGRRHSPL